MKQVVFKYALDGEETILKIPEGAQLLSVGFQRKNLVLWALVSPEKPKQTRTFLTLLTGQHFNFKSRGCVYVGTAQHEVDEFGLTHHTVHVFEKTIW